MMPPVRPTLAYILKGYPRISETFISNEILLLEQLGFRIHLFPMRKPRETFCHESVKQIRAAVDYLPTDLLLELPRLIAPNILAAVRTPGLYRSALGLAARRFQRTRKIATFKHLFQGGYLAEKHLAAHPEIIHLHGHFAHSPTSVTMFAAHLRRLPFSFTAHAKDIYTSHPDQLREKMAQASFVITCTMHNKEYLEAVGAGSSPPIYCIYHGIDLSLFSHTRKTPDCLPPYRLLTVARMTEKKGLPTIYQALRNLADRNVAFQHNL
ncbi:MAG: colanic acid biosynthesis glycosyltransferase WcaL, partial [Desulfocapsaceae bacterium]|nr:colanic acid biosynthesis glycosyltransferase WcaL [Desulfocapsaceae bacterium]